MKWSLLIVLGLFALTAQVKSESDSDLELELGLDSLEDLNESDEKLLRELEEKQNKNDINRENELANKLVEDSNRVLTPIVEVDPCEKMHCGAGRVCHSTGEEAECICIQDCPEENDTRRHVCTNKNVTWPSDCSVYQERCFCDTKDKRCTNPANSHLHIDYYGACQELPGCSEEEKKDFPRRMRDWLFNVMRDLAERDELTEHYMQMQMEAETNMTRRWANAAVWKWCDLDGNTDRSVSRHELFPIRAPLVSLEHCIAPFLESCDQNDDHRVTLVEWGNCLELEPDELYERCDDIQKSIPHLLG